MALPELWAKCRDTLVQLGSIAADTSFLLLWGLIQAVAEWVVENFPIQLSFVDQLILRLIQLAFAISTVLPIFNNVKTEYQIVQARNKRRVVIARELSVRPCTISQCPLERERAELGVSNG